MMLKAFVALLAVLLMGGAASAAPAISIELDGGHFRVVGWKPTSEPSPGWSSIFRVYAAEGDVPALTGSYRVSDGKLWFVPRFPITAGVHYRAVFDVPGAAESVTTRIDGPARPTERLTRLTQVFPSTDVLPSNALRLYLLFSAPMSRGEAWEHIHLIDLATNRPVELPFLELEQELWDQNNQRLTVFFDPGRIKRGLVPTTTIGPAIEEGKRYKLVIDREWHDARGAGLVEVGEKVFRGGPSDRVPPAPAQWRVAAPQAGTKEPLVITFAKPMDWALIQRMIGVFDEHGREITGSVSVGEGEKRFMLMPDELWVAGPYRIVADNTLEDISGNHLDRPFDVDVFETVTRRIKTVTTTLPFVVR